LNGDDTREDSGEVLVRARIRGVRAHGKQQDQERVGVPGVRRDMLGRHALEGGLIGCSSIGNEQG